MSLRFGVHELGANTVWLLQSNSALQSTRLRLLEIIRSNLLAQSYMLMLCLDFSKLGYETCKEWRTEPYPTFSANYANVTTTTTTTAPNTTREDRSPLKSASPPKPHSLSTGAYVGIGIVAVALTIGLLALASYFYRKRNDRKSGQSGEVIHEMSPTTLQELSAVGEPKPPLELLAPDWDQSKHPVELDARYPHDLEISKRW
jgi:hypothetical protein